MRIRGKARSCETMMHPKYNIPLLTTTYFNFIPEKERHVIDMLLIEESVPDLNPHIFGGSTYSLLIQSFWPIEWWHNLFLSNEMVIYRDDMMDDMFPRSTLESLC